MRNYEIVATAVNSSYYKVLAIRMMDSKSVEQDADIDDKSEYQETAEPSKSATLPDSDTALGVIAITNPQDGVDVILFLRQITTWVSLEIDYERSFKEVSGYSSCSGIY